MQEAVLRSVSLGILLSQVKIPTKRHHVPVTVHEVWVIIPLSQVMIPTLDRLVQIASSYDKS